MLLFVEYPKCTTCQKAKKWLEDNNISYFDRHIKDNNPTFDELSLWLEKSNLDIKKFFNTSGLLYKSMNLKDKLPTMAKDEKLRLLASDGMLVKRPIVISDELVLVGFNQNEWAEKLVQK